MKTYIRLFSLFIISAFLVASSISPAIAQDKKVRAKIGILIKSGDRVMRAKARDRLKADDLLRIYVHPEVSSHVYVVHTDHQTATLLNVVQQRIQSFTLVLPSIQDFYQVDGKSSIETFTVICSPNELKDLLTLMNSGEASYSKWAKLETGLLEKSRIDLSQKAERPFAIAGNVRGAPETTVGDPFMNKLQIFSGKSLLVKRYEFRVKK